MSPSDVWVSRSEQEGAPGHRREIREDGVHALQYCRFPRVCADPRLELAFTRDISASGLCVRVEGGELVGALLQLIPRGVDGEPETERIGRVAWTRPTADGGHWLGISLLDRTQHQPVWIQPVRRPSSRSAHSAPSPGSW